MRSAGWQACAHERQNARREAILQRLGMNGASRMKWKYGVRGAAGRPASRRGDSASQLAFSPAGTRRMSSLAAAIARQDHLVSRQAQTRLQRGGVRELRA